LPLRIFWLFLISLLPLSAFTNEIEAAHLYTPLKRVNKEELEKLLISDLKGIVLVPSKEKVLQGAALTEVSGIEILDLHLPGPSDRLKTKLEPFLGKPLTLNGAYEIRNAIARFYEDYYHPLVIVEVPTQDISHSILQLLVVEAKLGEVKVEGNEKWSKLDDIQSAIEIKPGDEINERILIRDLNFFNRSPYRKVDAIYEPGEEEATSNILLLVQDIKPYQFYLGTDNTGLKSTQSTLAYAGFSHGNCFGLGHTLSYQYTTSNFKAMQAHTAQYLAPLPNWHLLNLYGGYATVHPKATFPAFQNDGYAIQTSLRYLIPLLPTFSLRHDISAGFDYKRTNTNSIFDPHTAIDPFNQTVNLTQLMVGYNGSYQGENYLLLYFSELYFSPFSWLPQQSNFDYSQLRPGAKHKWIYFRGSFAYYQKLPYSCFLNILARGQVSSTPLLPSEQYGLGGFDTVRGYNERVLNDDDAVLLSAEFHTPTWRIVPFFSEKSTLTDGLELIAFIDSAWGHNIVLMPGEPRSGFLAGVGSGLRYYLDTYLTCRLDYGFKLHKSDVLGTSLGYLHFSFVASY
jgi:hemolysin activation/secretion protein